MENFHKYGTKDSIGSFQKLGYLLNRKIVDSYRAKSFKVKYLLIDKLWIIEIAFIIIIRSNMPLGDAVFLVTLVFTNIF